MSAVNDLMKGSIDIHVHAEPDVQARKTDCIELVQTGRKYGMAGMLIKDHVTLTSDRAYILNKIYPDFKVYGSIALNYPVGGINPTAVEGAIGLGCKMVYMPTYSSLNQVSNWGKGSHPHHYPFPKDAEGISILNEKGKLVVEVYEILEIIAQADIILATGHISPQESMLLVKESKNRGVQRILMTHPSLKLIDLSPANQIEAAKMGAYIEHCFVETTEFLRPKGITPIQEIARQIREVGVDRCVMSTDFGQTTNPHPVEGFREFIHQMLELGFSDTEIRKMIKENPAGLLEN